MTRRRLRRKRISRRSPAGEDPPNDELTKAEASEEIERLRKEAGLG